MYVFPMCVCVCAGLVPLRCAANAACCACARKTDESDRARERETERDIQCKREAESGARLLLPLIRFYCRHIPIENDVAEALASFRYVLSAMH